MHLRWHGERCCFGSRDGLYDEEVRGRVSDASEVGFGVVEMSKDGILLE